MDDACYSLGHLVVLEQPLDMLWCVQVNYVGKAVNLYEDAGYTLSGSSYVINKLLGTSWLWDRVRVSGGAYGGFSDFDSHNGMFTFLSYRDPNLLKTVRHFTRWKTETVHLRLSMKTSLWTRLPSPPCKPCFGMLCLRLAVDKTSN